MPGGKGGHKERGWERCPGAGRGVGREVGGPERKSRDEDWVWPGGGSIPGPSRFE